MIRMLVLLLLAVAGATQAQSLDHVRQAFAQRLYAQHADQVHDNRPQPLLRAVVVVRIRLGSNGQWAAEVLRDKAEEPEMTQVALASLQDVPVPENLSEDDRFQLSHVGFVEVWLFENNGRFALKTLAKPQVGLS